MFEKAAPTTGTIEQLSERPTRFALMREWVILTLQKLRSERDRTSATAISREKRPTFFSNPRDGTPAIFRVSTEQINPGWYLSLPHEKKELVAALDGLAVPMETLLDELLIGDIDRITSTPSDVLSKLIGFMSENMLEQARRMPDAKLWRDDQRLWKIASRIIIDAIFNRMGSDTKSLGDQSVEAMVTVVSKSGTWDKIRFAVPQYIDHLIKKYDLDERSYEAISKLTLAVTRSLDDLSKIVVFGPDTHAVAALDADLRQKQSAALAEVLEASVHLKEYHQSRLSITNANKYKTIQNLLVSTDGSASLNQEERELFDQLDSVSQTESLTAQEILDLNYQLSDAERVELDSLEQKFQQSAIGQAELIELESLSTKEAEQRLSQEESQRLMILRNKEAAHSLFNQTLRVRLDFLRLRKMRSVLLAEQNPGRLIELRTKSLSVITMTTESRKRLYELYNRSRDSNQKLTDEEECELHALTQEALRIDKLLEAEQLTGFLASVEDYEKEHRAEIQDTMRRERKRRIHYKIMSLLNNLQEGSWLFRIHRDWRLKNSTQHAMYHLDRNTVLESDKRVIVDVKSWIDVSVGDSKFHEIKDGSGRKEDVIAAIGIAEGHTESMMYASQALRIIYAQLFSSDISELRTMKKSKRADRVDALLAAVHRLTAEDIGNDINIAYPLLLPYLQNNPPLKRRLELFSNDQDHAALRKEIKQLVKDFEITKSAILPGFLFRAGIPEVLDFEQDRKSLIMVDGVPRIIKYHEAISNRQISAEEWLKNLSELAVYQQENPLADEDMQILSAIFNDLATQKNKAKLIANRRKLRRFIQKKFRARTFLQRDKHKILEEMIDFIQESAACDFTISIGSRTTDEFNNPANGYMVVNFGNGNGQFDVSRVNGVQSLAKRNIHYIDDGRDVGEEVPNIVKRSNRLLTSWMKKSGGNSSDTDASLNIQFPTRQFNFSRLIGSSEAGLAEKVKLKELKPLEVYFEVEWGPDQEPLFKDPGHQGLLEEVIEHQIAGVLESKKVAVQQLLTENKFSEVLVEGEKQCDVYFNFLRKKRLRKQVPEDWQRYLAENPDYNKYSAIELDLIQTSRMQEIVSRVDLEISLEKNHVLTLWKNSVSKAQKFASKYGSLDERTTSEKTKVSDTVLDWYRKYLEFDEFKTLVKEMRLGSLSTVVLTSIGLLSWQLMAGEFSSLLIPKSLDDARLDNIPFAADEEYANALGIFCVSTAGDANRTPLDASKIAEEWGSLLRNTHRLSMVFQACKSLADKKLSVYSAITASTDWLREALLELWVSFANPRVKAIARPGQLFSTLSGKDTQASGFTTVFTEGVKSAIGGMIQKLSKGGRKYTLSFRELVEDAEFDQIVASLPKELSGYEAYQKAITELRLAKQELVDEKVFWIKFSFVMSKLSKPVVRQAVNQWNGLLESQENDYLARFPTFLHFLVEYGAERILDPKVAPDKLPAQGSTATINMKHLKYYAGLYQKR